MTRLNHFGGLVVNRRSLLSPPHLATPAYVSKHPHLHAARFRENGRTVFSHSPRGTIWYLTSLCWASHHLPMPRTYCRMRVNVNEKYIIHTPPWVEWSRRASQDASSLRGERKEDKARLHHLLSVLLIFCFCLEGGGSCRCLQLHCARNPFFCHRPNQVM